MINKLMRAILEAVRERDFNYGPKITTETFAYTETEDREHKYEAAFCLSRLKELRLIEFDGQVITSGGQRHAKFDNSVAMIWWERVHITTEGMDYLNKQ